ncbi:hypothetical protein GCM10010116_56560 [Microbispora rosea subsp. aerata]|nr:hypothetical protein GCM10010116_56560 [Microbispora rosea subsp. aerata]GIH56203.1 hypothetical protein Mro02_31170 [Microbispora rosea subsp. aerata]GLJ85768.1 hypothetical protein GCM10017588_45010 [Microbispora rosea subsp. aerata]
MQGWRTRFSQSHQLGGKPYTEGDCSAVGHSAGLVLVTGDPPGGWTRGRAPVSQIRRTGGCRQPIHLRGKVEHWDKATGTLCTATAPTSNPTREVSSFGQGQAARRDLLIASMFLPSGPNGKINDALG